MNHRTKRCAHQWASTQRRRTQIHSHVSFWPRLSWILRSIPFLSSPFYPFSSSFPSFPFLPSFSFPPPSVSLLLNALPPICNPLLSITCPSSPLVFIPSPPCLHVLFHFLNVVIFLVFCSLPRFIFSGCLFLHLYFSSSSSTFSFFFLPTSRCRASTPMPQPIFENDLYCGTSHPKTLEWQSHAKPHSGEFSLATHPKYKLQHVSANVALPPKWRTRTFENNALAHLNSYDIAIMWIKVGQQAFCTNLSLNMANISLLQPPRAKPYVIFWATSMWCLHLVCLAS